MDANKMKNMVVIKNLPSNIVEEAFIILRSNQKSKVLKKIEKEQKSQIKEKTNDKNYIIKEAEMIVSNYISNIECTSKVKNHNIKELERKCKRLKITTAILCILVILNGIIGMFSK